MVTKEPAIFQYYGGLCIATLRQLGNNHVRIGYYSKHASGLDLDCSFDTKTRRTGYAEAVRRLP
jgi:hypothetical protein